MATIFRSFSRSASTFVQPECSCSCGALSAVQRSMCSQQQQRRARSSLRMSEPSASTSPGSSSAQAAAYTASNAAPSGSTVSFAASNVVGTAAGPSAARISRGSTYRPSTELPKIKDQRLLYFGVAGVAVTAWTLFVMWAMSAEKASSSVMRTIAFNLRSSTLVKEALGDGVRPKPFLMGEPWVHGKVNTIQGIVDINFRVTSANGKQGTVYFRSERPNKTARFETKEFKMRVDGRREPIDLMHAELRS